MDHVSFLLFSYCFLLVGFLWCIQRGGERYILSGMISSQDGGKQPAGNFFDFDFLFVVLRWIPFFVLIFFV